MFDVEMSVNNEKQNNEKGLIEGVLKNKIIFEMKIFTSWEMGNKGGELKCWVDGWEWGAGS